LACPPGSSAADIAAHLTNTLSEEHFRGYLASPDITILVIDADRELRGYSMLVARPAHYEKAGFLKVGTKSFRLGNTVEHDFCDGAPAPALT
jgi:hypothetical protein